MGGVNDDELPPLCALGLGARLMPRFIESMPMSDGALFTAGAFVAAAAIRDASRPRSARSSPTTARGIAGVGPARYLRVAGGAHAGARVGIISAVTEPFCETCNRVRLTATGQLHTCLALDDETDLRTPLRAGASDDELARKVLLRRIRQEGGPLVHRVRHGRPAKTHGGDRGLIPHT